MTFSDLWNLNLVWAKFNLIIIAVIVVSFVLLAVFMMTKQKRLLKKLHVISFTDWHFVSEERYYLLLTDAWHANMITREQVLSAESDRYFLRKFGKTAKTVRDEVDGKSVCQMDKFCNNENIMNVKPFYVESKLLHKVEE